MEHNDDRLFESDGQEPVETLPVFEETETEAILKKPSIAETLDWAAALDALGIRELTPDALRQTAGFLLKNNEDISTLWEEPKEHCHCGGHCHG